MVTCSYIFIPKASGPSHVTLGNYDYEYYDYPRSQDSNAASQSDTGVGAAVSAITYPEPTEREDENSSLVWRLAEQMSTTAISNSENPSQAPIATNLTVHYSPTTQNVHLAQNVFNRQNAYYGGGSSICSWNTTPLSNIPRATPSGAISEATSSGFHEGKRVLFQKQAEVNFKTRKLLPISILNLTLALLGFINNWTPMSLGKD